jgi:hypothetical protein
MITSYRPEAMKTIKRFWRGGGWQPRPIMALRAILQLTELFAAGEDAGKFAPGVN